MSSSTSAKAPARSSVIASTVAARRLRMLSPSGRPRASDTSRARTRGAPRCPRARNLGHVERHAAQIHPAQVQLRVAPRDAPAQDRARLEPALHIREVEPLQHGPHAARGHHAAPGKRHDPVAKLRHLFERVGDIEDGQAEGHAAARYRAGSRPCGGCRARPAARPSAAGAAEPAACARWRRAAARRPKADARAARKSGARSSTLDHVVEAE